MSQTVRAVALLAVSTLVACGAGVSTERDSARTGPAASRTAAAAASTRSATTAASTRSAATAASCLTTRRQPDPHRPQSRLDLTVSADHTRVIGREHVTFTPDLAVRKLVFRLTANSSYIVARGSHVSVRSATASPGGLAPRFVRAGASARTQGGLLEIPLARTVAAGTRMSIDIAFALDVSGAHYERFGRSGKFVWFASAQPLLAWEKGYGWHTENMIPFPAESATSEAMDTLLTVRAPLRDTVVATGDPVRPTVSGGQRVWTSRVSAARDLSVAVGPFIVSDTVVNGVKLRVAGYTRAARDRSVPEFRRAITELAKRFGRYPYPSLSVARLPGNDGGGIEYPAMIQMQSEARSDVVHETAHQWFYGMIGNSQSRDPWLDEAFAEYAERLVDRNPEPTSYLNARGSVGRSIQSYGTHESDYFFVTYAKGAAALEAARTAAGPAAWDRAVRCYVNRNAWRIVRPADFAAAIRAFPKSVAILRRAGALR